MTHGAGLRYGPVGQLSKVPTYKGYWDIIALMGNMGPVNSGSHMWFLKQVLISKLAPLPLNYTAPSSGNRICRMTWIQFTRDNLFKILFAALVKVLFFVDLLKVLMKLVYFWQIKICHFCNYVTCEFAHRLHLQISI